MNRFAKFNTILQPQHSDPHPLPAVDPPWKNLLETLPNFAIAKLFAFSSDINIENRNMEESDQIMISVSLNHLCCTSKRVPLFFWGARMIGQNESAHLKISKNNKKVPT